MTHATNGQVTVIQIDNDGPRTITPAPGRGMDLQRLRVQLSADVDETVFERAGAQGEDATDLAFEVGVGRDRTACDAGMTATEALDRCRESGTDVAAPATSEGV